MSLSAALGIINSSFATNAAQAAIVSQNVANANTAGYTSKTANLATTFFGGVDVASISSAANAALLDQVNSSTSESAAQQALATGLAQLAQTVDDSATSTSASGATQNGVSPSAMLANLQSALQTYAADPSSAPLGQAVVTAADNVAASLNSASAAVDKVREQADSQMSTDVAQINSILAQFATVNNTIVGGLAQGTDVTNSEDTRNSLLTQLSQLVGVNATTDSKGSMSIYTDSGVALFQNTPATVTFTASPTLVSGSTGNAVMVDGAPITGASAPMQVQSGELAGLSQLRDDVAPQYQSQLDQMAGALVNDFAETPQAGSGLASLPGLFTFTGAISLPTASTSTGLAGLIEVNPAVDPSQGGDASLIRDGGVNGASYVSNTTGAASYSATLLNDVSTLSAQTTFDASAGLGASGSLTAYAADSVSWLQAQNQQATNAADYQNSILTQSQSALSNATGVNMDKQMTDMLTLENTYATTAKLLTTVNDMLSSLMSAVN